MIEELENEILETRVIASKFISNDQQQKEESNKLKDEISILQSRLEVHNNELSKKKSNFFFLTHFPTSVERQLPLGITSTLQLRNALLYRINADIFTSFM